VATGGPLTLRAAILPLRTIPRRPLTLRAAILPLRTITRRATTLRAPLLPGLPFVTGRSAARSSGGSSGGTSRAAASGRGSAAARRTASCRACATLVGGTSSRSGTAVVPRSTGAASGKCHDFEVPHQLGGAHRLDADGMTGHKRERGSEHVALTPVR
jgi:hypothetical protein